MVRIQTLRPAILQHLVAPNLLLWLQRLGKAKATQQREAPKPTEAPEAPWPRGCIVSAVAIGENTNLVCSMHVGCYIGGWIK